MGAAHYSVSIVERLRDPVVVAVPFAIGERTTEGRVWWGCTDQVPVHELGSGRDGGISEMDGRGAPVEMHAVDLQTKK
jgi:hypothetical protein